MSTDITEVSNQNTCVLFFFLALLCHGSLDHVSWCSEHHIIFLLFTMDSRQFGYHEAINGSTALFPALGHLGKRNTQPLTTVTDHFVHREKLPLNSGAQELTATMAREWPLLFPGIDLYYSHIIYTTATRECVKNSKRTTKTTTTKWLSPLQTRSGYHCGWGVTLYNQEMTTTFIPLYLKNGHHIIILGNV